MTYFLTDIESNVLQKDIDNILDNKPNSLKLLGLFDKFLHDKSEADEASPIQIGDVVIYVPIHANKNINHKDCNYGIVINFNSKFVFVKYANKYGRIESTAKSTSPCDLYLCKVDDYLVNVNKIFNIIKENE